MEREKRTGANKRATIERTKKKLDLEATATSSETAQLHPRLPLDAPAIHPSPPSKKNKTDLGRHRDRLRRLGLPGALRLQRPGPRGAPPRAPRPLRRPRGAAPQAARRPGADRAAPGVRRQVRGGDREGHGGVDGRLQPDRRPGGDEELFPLGASTSTPRSGSRASPRGPRPASSASCTSRAWERARPRPRRGCRTKAAGEAAVKEAFGDGATVLRLRPLRRDRGLESELDRAARQGDARRAAHRRRGRLWQPVAAADVAAAAAATLRSPTAAEQGLRARGAQDLLVQGAGRSSCSTRCGSPAPRPTSPRRIAKIISRVPLGPLRHPWFSEGAVAEAAAPTWSPAASAAPPAGSSASGTLADLGVAATPIEDAIDHLRWLRAGGYDVGTLSENASTGGAGFGAKVA